MNNIDPSALGGTPLPPRDVLAYQLGAMRGLAERSAGWLKYNDSLLSGEWSDDPSFATLARSLGVLPPALVDGEHDEDEWFTYAEACWQVAHDYEAGYDAAWDL